MSDIDITIIQELKAAILRSRYQAARLVNKELVLLYLNIGKKINENAEKMAWGNKALDQISAELQKELPGLKGFSAGNLKKIRVFSSFWTSYFPIGSTLSNRLDKSPDAIYPTVSGKLYSIENELNNDDSNLDGATKLDQSDHEFINSFFSVSFSHHYLIASKSKTIAEATFYIQKTIAEFLYLGKMNSYLSVLDETVKQPNENPSIGIILCKEKNNKVVEYSFRDFSKAMGVATYKTSHEIPEQYKEILPNAETLKKLMD